MHHYSCSHTSITIDIIDSMYYQHTTTPLVSEVPVVVVPAVPVVPVKAVINSTTQYLVFIYVFKKYFLYMLRDFYTKG